MSRSFRYTPIGGITSADSEKRDKRIANRKMRRNNKLRLEDNRIPDEYRMFINIREAYNTYNFDKDGKTYFGPINNDPLDHKLMRK